MHESLVSGDAIAPRQRGEKKEVKQRKKEKENGAEEENGERWKRVRRSSAG